MAIVAIIVTFLGKLSDSIGREPIMYTGLIMLIVLPIPLFMLILGGDYLWIFLGTLPIGLMLVTFMATEPSTADRSRSCACRRGRIVVRHGGRWSNTTRTHDLRRSPPYLRRYRCGVA